MKFISEVSSNHSRDLDRCLEFIDVSAEIGCWGVKFQLFEVTKLFSSEALRIKPELLNRQDWELPVDFLPILAERAKTRGIKFGCTPFHLEAVEDLKDHVDFFKVASYELLWLELVKACAATGLPLLVSTGMATLEEIQNVVTVTEGLEDFALLHCTSSYPTPPNQANLRAIDTIRRATGRAVGWSDHTVSPIVIYRAVTHWDAAYVEFHLDLDGSGDEFRTGHCWLPEQIKPIIEDVSQLVKIDGDGIKQPAPSELADRDWRADPSDGLRPLIATRRLLDCK